jgi:predicted permease
MDWRKEVRSALRAVTGDAARDEEIVAELAEHLAQRYDELRTIGLDADDARRRTLDELRSDTRLRSALRGADRPRPLAPHPPSMSGRPRMIHDLWQDIRYAARMLGKNAGFTMAAVLTLALGIGATTAIFSVVDAVLLKRVPFAEQDRLMMVWETDRNTGTTREPASYPDFVDFTQRSRQIEAFAAFGAGEANHTPNEGEPQRLAAMVVSERFLPVIGVKPQLGRNVTSEETAANGPPAVLISDRLWERLFHRRPDILGQTLRLNERDRPIIGVMPRDADFGIMQVLGLAAYNRAFADRDARSRVDVWLPLRYDPAIPNQRSTHPIFVVGRLAEGATPVTAQQELAGIMSALEAAYPENRARGVFIEPIGDVVFGRVRPALWVLLAAVGVVLLIACVNVANLLLARGTARVREVAVRSALGAVSRRLARQFVAESLVLTLGASVLGVLLAFGGLRALVAMAPADIPRLSSVAVDARVLGAALAMALTTALVFGLVPLMQSRRLDLQTALKSDDGRGATSGRERTWFRSSLVVTEIALAAVLVVAAGLLIKSFWRVQQIDPGFDVRGVVKAEFQLPRSRYPTNNWPNFVEVHRFNADLLRRVRSLPGVETAAIAGNHPLDAGFTNSFTIVGREAEGRDWGEISVRRVTPSYFETVKLALRRGRLFTENDGAVAPAVGLINETAARRFFEGRQPLGQQIRFWGLARTIVGVVADERFLGLTRESPPAIYAPLDQAPSYTHDEVLLVRATGTGASQLGPMRAAINEVDRGVAVFGMEPLTQTVSESIGQRRFVMLLLVLFAILAVTLAAIGIHGVLSYSVAQRRHEIGIRMALGAGPGRVTRLVMAQGARLTAVGVAIGLAGALMALRLLTRLLYGVSAADVATMATAIPLLVVVAMVATYLPARRAVRGDPLGALRDE